MALDAIAELGARNVLITLETGCFALFREERQVRRFRAIVPATSRPSPSSARATSCSHRSSRRAWRASRPRRRCGSRSRPAPPRRSRSAPGRFDPREAGRLVGARRGRRAGLARAEHVGALVRWSRLRPAWQSSWCAESSSELSSRRSSAGKASPSTTCCSCRPSRRCSRTTSRTATRLTRAIALEIPIVSAAMDTVTEARLAIALAREGGIGIVHRNLSIDDQVAEVDKVKRSESGMIVEPVTLRPDDLGRRRARADGALPHLRRPDHRRGRRPRRDPHQPRPPLRGRTSASRSRR